MASIKAKRKQDTNLTLDDVHDEMRKGIFSDACVAPRCEPQTGSPTSHPTAVCIAAIKLQLQLGLRCTRGFACREAHAITIADHENHQSLQKEIENSLRCAPANSTNKHRTGSAHIVGQAQASGRDSQSKLTGPSRAIWANPVKPVLREHPLAPLYLVLWPSCAGKESSPTA